MPDASINRHLHPTRHGHAANVASRGPCDQITSADARDIRDDCPMIAAPQKSNEQLRRGAAG